MPVCATRGEGCFLLAASPTVRHHRVCVRLISPSSLSVCLRVRLRRSSSLSSSSLLLCMWGVRGCRVWFVHGRDEVSGQEASFRLIASSALCHVSKPGPIAACLTMCPIVCVCGCGGDEGDLTTVVLGGVCIYRIQGDSAGHQTGRWVDVGGGRGGGNEVT